MSDQDVLKALEDMERYLILDQPALDPAQLELLHDRFRAAVSSAERGPDWCAITERVLSVQQALQSRLSSVIQQRDAVRRELEGQGLGQRALSAYKSSNG